MKLLLAIALAGSLYAQTKNYNLNVVHLGSVNSASATGTKPFREVASASGACSLAGEIVSIIGSAEIYKCPSNTMTWTLITGSGESITVSAPLSRSGDVISCPTCATTSVTALTQLASVGVITSGVWQGTRVAIAYGGTSSDLSATGPGYLRQASTGAVVTVAMPAYSDLTGVPLTFTPSAHATAHQHGGSDQVATATPGANAIPKADGSNKLAAGWMSEVLTLANLSDVSGKQGAGTLVATVTGTLVQGNALTVDSSGSIVDSGVTPGGGGSSAFSAITSATNTQAAMVVGNGASLAATGAGTIAATSLSALTGLPNQADGTILANFSGGSAPASATTPASMGGKFSIDNLSNARVSKTDGTHLALSAGGGRCGSTLYSISAIASITLASGSAGTVHIGSNCRAAGAIVVAHGSALTVSGSGFTPSSADDFTATPWIIPIASVPVVSSAFTTVTENRTFATSNYIEAGTGIQCPINVDGVQQCGIDGTVLQKATHQSGGALRCASSTGSDTYTCTMTPTLGGYTDGMVVEFEATATANTGAASLNIDTLGAVNIKLCDGSTDPANSDIAVGRQVALRYDGTVFRLPCAGSGSSVNEYISICQNDWDPWNASASTTYYAGAYISGQASNNGLVRFPSPVDGTIVGLTVAAYISTTVGVGSTTDVTIQKAGSDTSVTANISLTSTDTVASGTGSTAVSKGDMLNYKLVLGAYSTSPVGLRMRYCTLIKTN